MLICPKCGKVGSCNIKVADHFSAINVTEGYLSRAKYYGKPSCPKCGSELKVVKNLNDLYLNSFRSEFIDTVTSTTGKKEARIIIKKFDELFKNCIAIPKGATYGDLIKSITNKEFDNGDSDYNDDLIISNGKDYIACSIDFWNKQYGE